MIDRAQRAAFSEQLQARRRGRPRCAVPRVPMTLKLPEDVYDSLCRRARIERKSLHGLVCEVLAQRSIRGELNFGNN